MTPTQLDHIAQLLIDQSETHEPNAEIADVKENASLEEKQMISDRVIEMMKP